MDRKMPPKRGEHPIISVILLMIGLLIMGGGLHYNLGALEQPGAGFLPFFSGLFVTVFSAATLFQNIKHRWRPLQALWEETRWQRALILTVCLICYSAFLSYLGFLLSTTLFMGVLLKVMEGKSWRMTILASISTTVGFYLVFQTWLQVQLPRGFLNF